MVRPSPLTEAERTRSVVVHDAPDERYTVDGKRRHRQRRPPDIAPTYLIESTCATS